MSQCCEKPEDAKSPNVPITFQVNSPTFYSRFFHYVSPDSAIQAELFAADEQGRTAWCSDPVNFGSIFASPVEHKPNFPDWKWRILCMLRCPPAETNYAIKDAYHPFKGISVSDQFVVDHCTAQQLCDYHRILLRVYLGEWMGGFSFGSLSGDLELVSLSRDAVVRVYDALFKTALALSTVVLVRSSQDVGGYSKLAMIAFAGLNLWACLKACM